MGDATKRPMSGRERTARWRARRRAAALAATNATFVEFGQLRLRVMTEADVGRIVDRNVATLDRIFGRHKSNP